MTQSSGSFLLAAVSKQRSRAGAATVTLGPTPGVAAVAEAEARVTIAGRIVVAAASRKVDSALDPTST